MTTDKNWRNKLIAGAISGFLAGILLGIQFILYTEYRGRTASPIDLMALSFGELTGTGFTANDGWLGWIILLIATILLGVIYAAALTLTNRNPESIDRGTVLRGGLFGAVYGLVVLLVVFAGIYRQILIMTLPDLFVDNILTPITHEILAVPSTSAHLTFGVAIGILYTVLSVKLDS